MTRTFRVALLSISALCSACANQAPVYGGLTNATATNNSSTTSSGSTTVVSGGSTSSSSTSTSTGTEPLIPMQVSGVGYVTETLTVTTGSTLKMTFAPGTNSATISGTGVDPQYSQLGVYITVNGTTQNTGMLSNGLYTGQIQTSPVLDFSSALPTCSGTTASCQHAVTITISHPNDDYFCLNYGYDCPWAQMYYDHPWNGNLQIQTDNTVAL